jgi:hypothetical protein
MIFFLIRLYNHRTKTIIMNEKMKCIYKESYYTTEDSIYFNKWMIIVLFFQ